MVKLVNNCDIEGPIARQERLKNNLRIEFQTSQAYLTILENLSDQRCVHCV